MKTLLFSFVLAGIVPTSIAQDKVDFNYWGTDVHWNLCNPSQLNASHVSFALPNPLGTLHDSGTVEATGGGSFASTKHGNSKKPLSATSDTTGCPLNFFEGLQLEKSDQYSASYDSLQNFVQTCPTNFYSPGAFSLMEDDVTYGGLGASPQCWLDFRSWLLSALAWNPGSPTYFCADVQALAFTFGSTDDTTWQEGNTDGNKAMSVIYWILHNPLCTNASDSTLYIDTRGSQYETYENYPGLNRDSVPFDTTIYTMDELGLDSVLKYAALLGVSENTPSIITNPNAYPNPTGTGTEISFGTTREAYVLVQLFDVLGQEAGATEFGNVLEPGNHEVPILLQGLPAGTYFARIQTTYGEAQTVKLVKN